MIEVADTVGSNSYSLLYTYDDCGNLASATDRNGNRTDYSHDCFGNLTQREEPQLNAQTPRYTTSWTYDSRNNPSVAPLSWSLTHYVIASFASERSARDLRAGARGRWSTYPISDRGRNPALDLVGALSSRPLPFA